MDDLNKESFGQPGQPGQLGQDGQPGSIGDPNPGGFGGVGGQGGQGGSGSIGKTGTAGKQGEVGAQGKQGIPGKPARNWFGLAGYLVLAFAFVAGLWGVDHRSDVKLRSHLNDIVVAGCHNSIPTLNKYNAGVDIQIGIQEDAKDLNTIRGDTARVQINVRAIEALQTTKIKPPTEKECDERKPF